MWNMENWQDWRVVAKLDPDKYIGKDVLRGVIDAGFDAIIVGGTQGITGEKTARLIDAVLENGFAGPLVQEVTSVEAVTEGRVQAYFLPLVLNARDIRWLAGIHHLAIKRYSGRIPWDRTVTEGYIICNPASAAGRLTGASTVGVEDTLAYCDLAEQVLGLPLLYLEYSGIFGNPRLVEAVARHREKIRLFYGGGLNSAPRARTMAALADTVIVGNVIYENPVIIDNIISAVSYTARR